MKSIYLQYSKNNSSNIKQQVQSQTIYIRLLS